MGKNENTPYIQNAANTDIISSPVSDVLKKVIASVTHIQENPRAAALRRGDENLSW